MTSGVGMRPNADRGAARYVVVCAWRPARDGGPVRSGPAPGRPPSSGRGTGLPRPRPGFPGAAVRSPPRSARPAAPAAAAGRAPPPHAASPGAPASAPGSNHPPRRRPGASPQHLLDGGEVVASWNSAISRAPRPGRRPIRIVADIGGLQREIDPPRRVIAVSGAMICLPNRNRAWPRVRCVRDCGSGSALRSPPSDRPGVIRAPAWTWTFLLPPHAQATERRRLRLTLPEPPRDQGRSGSVSACRDCRAPCSLPRARSASPGESGQGGGKVDLLDTGELRL